MTDAQLLEDTFTITSINNEKYDRVSRLYGTSADNTLSLHLDINHELFPVSTGEQVTLCLATTLNLDGTKDDKGWRETKDEAMLADMYDYVCYGTVYRIEDAADNESAKVFSSFGGLLLYLEGPYKKLQPMKMDRLYLLLKK